MLSGLDSPLHILIVLVVVLLVFGGKRMPELGRSLGTGLREFRDSVTGAPGTSPDSLPPPATTPPDTPPGQSER
jgi:sec-independent protein translocase protein TatA